jgi:hypothetical protein
VYAAGPAGPRSVAARVAATAAAGDTFTVRMPRRFRCGEYDEVRVRTVYAGGRAVIAEDIAAPHAGAMDASFERLGEEFDAVMWPLVLENFGDPLGYAVGGQSADRLLMIFSERVNDLELGGFVWAGDFYPRDQCAASNETPAFYAIVPSPSSSVQITVERWERWMPSTLIHEAKHVASYAERFSRGAERMEETWLEEATARIAEELWARTVYGYVQRGDHGYEDGIVCEVNPGTCPADAHVMLKHYGALYQYFRELEVLSVLGRARDDDWTFYASAWLLVRWLLDHSDQDESALLRSLVQQSRDAGRANLEARFGLPWTFIDYPTGL